MQRIIDFYSVYTVPRIIFTVVILSFATLCIIDLIASIYYEFKLGVLSMFWDSKDYTFNLNERKAKCKNSWILFVICSLLRSIVVFIGVGAFACFYSIATVSGFGDGEALFTSVNLVFHPMKTLELNGKTHMLEDKNGNKAYVNSYVISFLAVLNGSMLFWICMLVITGGICMYIV